MLNRKSSIEVSGGGLSGLSFGYLGIRQNLDIVIYEKKTYEQWEKVNARPYLIKLAHLKAIENTSPDIVKIIQTCSKPIYKVRKIIADFKNNIYTEFQYKSKSKPIFYVLNAIDFFKSLINDVNLKIKFNEKGKGLVRAEGGAVWGNILALGRTIDNELDEVVLWYDQNIIPGSYIFESPIPGTGKSLIMAVIFDFNKYLIEIPPIVKPIEIVVKTGYTHPHLLEDHYITIGERGGWIDPLRGFGFYTSILSAAAAVTYMIKGQIPEFLRNLEEEINKNITLRERLVKMTNQDIINMLKGKKEYISISENVKEIR